MFSERTQSRTGSGGTGRGVERDLGVTTLDGLLLLLDHYYPRAGHAGPTEDTGGVVVWIRTPYGRKGIGSIAKRFAKCGAHVIVEAVRGTDGSGGTFDGVTFYPSDAADVAAWLRTQEWFPGAIVTWGISLIGYASWAVTEVEIPEWRLAILQDAQSELRDSIIYPGGVFAGAVMLGFVHSVEWQARHPRVSLARTMLAAVRGARRAKKVLAELPLGTADERLVGHRVDYFQQWLRNEHDDEYWQRFNLRRHGAEMPESVHLASGWYDVCLGSVLADYGALRATGKTPRLIVGPWYHGRGSIDKSYIGEINAWLDATMRGGVAVAQQVRLHVGGADEWRELSDWPAPGYQPTDWYLHPDGVLSTRRAPESAPDTYRYDPTDPTPAVGGAMENWDGAAGAKDNRKLEARPDVLTYTSDVLTDDLEIIGPVTATILMRSSLEHTDLFTRLCDVEPSGRSINLCDGVRRLAPNEPPADGDGIRTVELDLIGIAHRFRAGHRIRLQISSGAHPRLVRNTGTGEPLATATTSRAAEQEIFHDPAHPSVLRLPQQDEASAGLIA